MNQVAVPESSEGRRVEGRGGNFSVNLNIHLLTCVDIVVMANVPHRISKQCIGGFPDSLAPRKYVWVPRVATAEWACGFGKLVACLWPRQEGRAICGYIIPFAIGECSTHIPAV